MIEPIGFPSWGVTSVECFGPHFLCAAPVNLLWTAGWDSTYRLLDLVVTKRREVTPHYVVDPNRRGTLYELRAMREIRQRVAEDFPDRASLILPTKLTLVDSIEVCPDVSEKLARLKARSFLGQQYDWLARYINQRGIDDLELCIHADDRAEGFVRDRVERVAPHDGEAYWRLPSAAARDDVGLFAHFRFPILHLTKREMRRHADAAGFRRIMAATWFCHQPIGGQPCGLCNPCRYTIAEGLSERLPLRALVRNRAVSQLNTMRRICRPFYRRLFAGVKRAT